MAANFSQRGKPLPHRPFSLAPALEAGNLGRCVSNTSTMSGASSILLTPQQPTFHVPPPTKAYVSQHRYPVAPALRTLQLQKTTTTHSFSSDAHLVSQQKAVLSDRKPPSWLRRHWFVVTVIILTTIGIVLAVVGVLATHKGGKSRDAGVFVPGGFETAVSAIATPTSG